MSIFTVCVVGAESTGKSWLAANLAAHFGVVAVTEYARAYCASHGNALTMEQLVHIGSVQDSNIRGTVAASFTADASIVIADTDAIVTAVWAQHGLGHSDPWFDGDLFQSDLYLVTENDLPWEDDGVRIQTEQEQRNRFRTALTGELGRRRLRWVGIAGTGDVRLGRALAAIAALPR